MDSAKPLAMACRWASLSLAWILLACGPAQAQTRPLNDTGITWSGDATSRNAATCDPAHPVGQDCHYGRDKDAPAKIGGGTAGFDFTALNASGQPTTPSSGATPHPCVRDNVTGLIWEVKTDDGGLHDKDWIYTWYKTGSPVGYNGTSSGTTYCKTSGRCDTEKFVQDVNAAGWCGLFDWRMPTVKELEGIADLGRTSPAIAPTFFPNTPSSYFWSGSPYAGVMFNAWYVNFSNGYANSAGSGYSSHPSHVRLVRGGE
jgi:hypothetical protein